ncbi:MAG: HEPN domain-containing protein [Planctomycetes bacterium]|nr:HEPN domain-containing protein [Planctomycetota bacterium]
MKKRTKTWLELATNDLDLAKELLDRKGRVYYAAHFCHQAIEKLLKVIIAERTDEIPLPTHNFKILLDQTKLNDIPEDKKRFIFSLMPHYIGTKYPEDITQLYKRYTKVFVQRLYKETYEVFQWLKAYLKSKKS